MPTQLKRLHALIVRGLEKTAALWPDIRVANGWVHRAAHLLANQEGRPGEEVRREYKALLVEMQMVANRQGAGSRVGSRVGSGSGVSVTMRQWVEYFLKVTDSYWPGLFYCYDTPDLPQTNNDLEQCFGTARHHERRATGRKQTSGMLVVRGRVRLLAAVALATALATNAAQTRTIAYGQASATMQLEGFSVQDLQLRTPEQQNEWKQMRAQLEYRQATRRAQFRFRKDPDLYLSKLEALLLKPTLPF